MTDKVKTESEKKPPVDVKKIPPNKNASNLSGGTGEPPPPPPSPPGSP